MTRTRVPYLICFLLSVLITYGEGFSQVNTASSQRPVHPLDPLTAEEIQQTVAILQADARFGPDTMAVLVGAIPEAEQADFMQRILADTVMTQATYYYSYYVLEALLEAGLLLHSGVQEISY